MNVKTCLKKFKGRKCRSLRSYINKTESRKMIMFNFFKRDRKNKVETLPNIEIDNCVMTDTLSDSEDNLLTANQARELVDSVGSNFKEELFEELRYRAENG